MRKFYVASVLLLLAFNGIAQIKKSSILLGGQISYFSDKNEGLNLNQRFERGNIDLLAGKAIKENKIVGINFSFSPFRLSNNNYNGDTSRLHLNRFSVGVFYRFYRKLTKDLYFFNQLEGSFITSLSLEHINYNPGEIRTTQRGGLISFTPGIAYQLFKKVQFEMVIPDVLGIHYLVTNTKSQVTQVPNSREETFGFNTSISNNTGLAFLAVGFKFIL